MLKVEGSHQIRLLKVLLGELNPLRGVLEIAVSSYSYVYDWLMVLTIYVWGPNQ